MPSEFLIPYAGKGSRYGSEEIDVLRELLLSDAHLAGDVQNRAFEAEMAGYLGVRNAIATSSCSMALELVTRVLDLRPDDEVIVSPLTYQASAWSLLDRRCRVVFCDIDDETLCLDPASVERSLTESTRAVIVTHYGGAMARVDELRALCDRHQAALIEDCAHALGASYRGHAPGCVGDFGCFSFQSLKNVSTLGQGGMITVADDQFAARLRAMRCGEPDAVFIRRPGSTALDAAMVSATGDLSLVPGVETHQKNAYTHDCLAVRAGGLNALLSEPAAAVGRVQLGRLPALLAERQRLAARLDSGLRRIDGLRVPRIPPGAAHAHHLYTFFVTPSASTSRNELVAGLADAGIEVVLRYFPVHLLPEWRARRARRDCPVAERIWFRELVNLPIYPGMTDEQADYMIETISALMSGPARSGHILGERSEVFEAG